MARRVPIRLFATLNEMAGGFPIAHKVYLAAVVVFSSFNLGSVLASDTLAYASWLKVSQPFTDSIANFMPAARVATAFLEEHRAFLEQHNVLYWVPAVRNVLSTDFAMFFFFQASFAITIAIDLIMDPDRALVNYNTACGKLGYPVGNLMLRLLCMLLVFCSPIFFGALGLANPYLLGLSLSVQKYFFLIGFAGLFLFAFLYLAIPLTFLKLGLSAAHQDASAPD